MGFLQDFKKFAMKGSVVDLAVGVVIGAAFGKIVSAIVDNIVMPPLGLLIGGVHFSQLRLVLKPADASGHTEVALGIGSLLDATIDFLIIAFALFLVIRGINHFRLKPDTSPPEDVKLLREIRDLLSASKTSPG
jgi:large conductance mechanosensitive channel